MGVGCCRFRRMSCSRSCRFAFWRAAEVGLVSGKISSLRVEVSEKRGVSKSRKGCCVLSGVYSVLAS